MFSFVKPSFESKTLHFSLTLDSTWLVYYIVVDCIKHDFFVLISLLNVLQNESANALNIQSRLNWEDFLKIFSIFKKLIELLLSHIENLAICIWNNLVLSFLVNCAFWGVVLRFDKFFMSKNVANHQFLHSVNIFSIKFAHFPARSWLWVVIAIINIHYDLFVKFPWSHNVKFISDWALSKHTLCWFVGLYPCLIY